MAGTKEGSVLISPNKILGYFLPGTGLLRFKPYGNGHINDTYLVETNKGNFILQRINKNVFRIDELVSNYEVLFNALDDYRKNYGYKLTPALYRTTSGKFHFVDEEGYAWRLAELLPDAVSYEIGENTEVSYHAAKAMGRFQLFLNTFSQNDFGETIINFHDLPRRHGDFQRSLTNAAGDRLKNAKAEIDQSEEYGFIVREYESVAAKLPKRVTHNDTKINNILFADDVILVIDLDTVMPGAIMYDYGDMVRTFTSPAEEDEQDLEKVIFRTEHFEALTKGYLEPLKDNLTAGEKKSLLTGAKSIIYEQALRFLTDYLNGDIYYKTAYPEHNLVRARTQFKLLEGIMENEKKLIEIIGNSEKIK